MRVRGSSGTTSNSAIVLTERMLGENQVETKVTPGGRVAEMMPIVKNGATVTINVGTAAMTANQELRPEVKMKVRRRHS